MITKMKTAQKGFSLIELLVVLAVIGILAAIIIPVVGGVRKSAAETAGKAQFSQWRQAFELYRQEYGYYPQFFTGSSPSNDELLVNRSDSENDYDGTLFYESLTGRKLNGDRLESGDDGYDAGNVRSASFYTFSEEEVEREGNNIIIRDHFGNGDIAVFFDLNQDGIIKFGGTNADYTTTTLPEVKSVRTGMTFRPTVGDNDDDVIPSEGIRAGVIFYSGGYGDELFMSWR